MRAQSPSRFQLRAWLIGACAGLAVMGCPLRLAAQTESTTPRWGGRPYFAGKNTSIFSSPVIGRDRTIYFGVERNTSPPSGLIVALTPNGDEKWVFPKTNATLIEEIEAGPALSPDGDTLYVACTDGRVYILDAQTGNLKGNGDAGRASAVFSTPAVAANGTVYFGATYLGDVISQQDSLFYAMSPAGATVASASIAGLMDSSPAIGTDGTVYAGAGHIFYAFSAALQQKWSRSMAGPIHASPAIGWDGTIYVGSDGGDFYALKPNNEVKWQANVSPGTGIAIGADDTVYVGSTNGRMYAFGPDGSTRKGWPVDFGVSILSTPAIRADGSLIFAAGSNVYAYNSDGTRKWSLFVNDTVESSPVVDADGTIYFGTTGGNLYALPGSGSGLSTYSAWPMYGRDIVHSGRAVAPITGGRLINLATRGPAGSGKDLIAGFVVVGSGIKPLLIRGVGPTLRDYGIASPLADPALTLYFETGTSSSPIYHNDDWNLDPDADLIAQTTPRVGAFPLPRGSKDAAAFAQVAVTGATRYTVTVEGASGASGVAMAEVYDADPHGTNATLLNLSARGQVGVGENVLIPGLVVGGSGQLRVLIRAVGPGLRQFNVPSPIMQPSITVFNNHTGQIATNTGWTSGGLKGDILGAGALVGAFPLLESNADSAMILTLDPDDYTFRISGVGDATGEALVEVYALPH